MSRTDSEMGKHHNMTAPTIIPEIAPKTHILPNPKLCRTSPLDIGIHYGVCLVADSLDCRYAKAYGEVHAVCTHPNWYEYIKQTESRQ